MFSPRTAFLSTPSARRATRGRLRQLPHQHHFYPRPPRGGRRSAATPIKSTIRFLSTPSARRATRSCTRCRGRAKDFYPRPPRGGRRGGSSYSRELFLFLSTPSARRATLTTVDDLIAQNCISIHALREEGDSSGLRTFCTGIDFYPRPPRGGRLLPGSCGKRRKNFYPRPPRGGRPARRLSQR